MVTERIDSTKITRRGPRFATDTRPDRRRARSAAACVAMPRWALLAAMVAVGTPALTMAQTPDTPRDTARLEDITVTATRVPVAARDLASTLTVLDGDELRAQGVTKVADALRSVPGATVLQTGSFGGATSLFLRGGESDYVQVLIDGVPVNQPGGAYDFANLSTQNVDRIEILRGPGSVLYGSEATAGVVQIFTRQGVGPARVSAGVRAGTYGSVGLDADFVGGGANVGYAFGLEHFFTDGAYAFNNDYDNTVLSGRVQVRPDAATDVSLSLRYRDSKFHFPTDGSGNLVDGNAFSVDEATTIAVEAGRFFSRRVEGRLLLASNVTAGSSEDRQDSDADTLGFFSSNSLQDLSRQSAEFRVNVYAGLGIVLTSGVQIEEQEERSFSELQSEFGPTNSSSAVDRSNRAWYGQALFNRAGLSLTAGGRVDDNEVFGTFNTFRAAAAYRFASGTRVRGSYGKSFKAPTFFETDATGFVTGNPDLQPERSSTWEVGVEQGLGGGRVVVGGTYFHQRFRDLIQFTFDATPNYFNVGEADAAGVELELVLRPGAGVSMTASATILDTEVIDAGFESGEDAAFVVGERLLRRPTTSFSVGASYHGWNRGQFGLQLHRVGDRDDRDFSAFPAARVELPAYTLVDLSAQIRLLDDGSAGPEVTWTFRVENLFDEGYEPVVGFPARGRTVFVGARVGGGG